MAQNCNRFYCWGHALRRRTPQGRRHRRNRHGRELGRCAPQDHRNVFEGLWAAPRVLVQHRVNQVNHAAGRSRTTASRRGAVSRGNHRK